VIGWIILGIIVALIVAPFFVPITVTVGLDERRRDWSVRVGSLQVAPEGAAHFKAFRERWAIRLRPLKIAGKALITALGWIFAALFWVFKAVIWPFRMALSIFGKRKKTAISPQPPYDQPQKTEMPEEEFVPPEPPPPAESGGGEPAEPGEPGGEIRRRDDPGFTSESPENEERGEEAKPDEEQPPPPLSKDEQSQWDDTEKEEPGKKQAGFARLLATVRNGIAYLREYGPMGRRILRTVLRFLGDCLSAPHFKKLDARYGFGGDPAALGALLGWHYALLGSIHPSLPGHVVFVPAFDQEPAPVWGSLDMIVVIWPYRFVLATFRLILCLPLWGLWRAYRRYRRGELLPTASSGVAA
jgi:hypothetical protein